MTMVLPASPLDITDAGGRRVCALHGSIDVFVAGAVVPRVLQGLPDGTDRVVLDLSDVVTLDSAGLYEIVAAVHRAHDRGLRLTAELGTDRHLSPTAEAVIRHAVG